MKFILQITLILCSFSMYHNNEFNDQPTDISLNESRLPTRTKPPIFPKIKANFIMERQKLINKDKYTKKNVTKKPIMPKLVPKAKIQVDTSNKILVTRRPMMKLRTYTMKTYSNFKTITINKDNDENVKDKKAESKDITIKNNTSHYWKKINDGFVKPSKIYRRERLVFPTPVNYYAEESRDRNEYIFLNRITDENVKKISIAHDFLKPEDQEYETTTEGYEVSRVKRNVNIIEEESKPTKYPRWKNNEHDTKVNNDRFYNNVNT